MPTDRRTERSTLRGEAAKLYLERLARRVGLRAIAVADELGLLVAGAGDAGILETLAAAGALSTRGQSRARSDLATELATLGECSYSSIDVGGVPLYLATLGGDCPDTDDVSAAISRILLS